MRHFLRRQGAALPVGGLARRVSEAALARSLIAPPRLPPAALTRSPTAHPPAVALPPVTLRAHVDRS